MSMQNGLILYAAILGFTHIKWSAKGERQAGEMLTLHLCPKTEGGSLDAKPSEIFVPQDSMSTVQLKLRTLKQFDPVFVSLEQQRDRLVFKSFVDFPGAATK